MGCITNSKLNLVEVLLERLDFNQRRIVKYSKNGMDEEKLSAIKQQQEKIKEKLIVANRDLKELVLLMAETGLSEHELETIESNPSVELARRTIKRSLDEEEEENKKKCCRCKKELKNPSKKQQHELTHKARSSY